MEMLAEGYERGLGVKQSDKKAIEFYEMAAKKGNANSQKNTTKKNKNKKRCQSTLVP